MSDKRLSNEEWRRAAFGEALRRLPPPLPCFSDGAACPWCGHLHQTITFGGNNCRECSRWFCFGFPPWGSLLEHSPETYVPFPHRAWAELGEKPSLLPPWEPNDLLKANYKRIEQWLEDANPKPKPGERLQ